MMMYSVILNDGERSFVLEQYSFVSNILHFILFGFFLLSVHHQCKQLSVYSNINTCNIVV